MTAFNENQYDDVYPPGIENHFWVRARNAIIFDLVRSAGVAGGKLMEIGCGPGLVVKYLRERGIDCFGCELAKAPIPQGLAPYVTVGIDATHLPEEARHSIDCLLMLDVIEHIEDASGFVRHMAEAFPKARCLLITVPAHSELWSNWDEHYGHFRRYTPVGLGRDLEAAGFKPARICQFFHSLYVPMRLMALAGRRRSKQHATPKWPALHATIAWLFYQEYKLLPAGLVGTSVAALAFRDSVT